MRHIYIVKRPELEIEERSQPGVWRRRVLPFRKKQVSLRGLWVGSFGRYVGALVNTSVFHKILATSVHRF